jgi:hypothetical protein
MSTRRSIHRFVAAAVLLSVVVAPVTAGAVGGATAAVGSSDHPQLAAGQLDGEGVETDSVRMRIALSPNGTATWTVQYWTRLDDENTTAAFESLQSDVESDPAAFTDRFADRMRVTVRAAENATGREMTATDFAVSAETRAPPEYGVVTYTFRWEGFAAVDGDTVSAGDAIAGLFLADNTRLVVAWPEGYAASEVTPAPDERRTNAVVWRGAETSFVSGEPRIAVRPARATTTAAGGDGTDDGTGDGEDGSALLVPALIVALLGLGIGGWVVWDRRQRAAPSDTPGDGDGVSTGADGDAGTVDPEGDTASGEPPEDLLSNEERVVRFVRERGGRVKQQEIVEAFDWTEARTSQIVRDLREEGELEGFRLGRENVLKLPEEDEDGSGSA